MPLGCINFQQLPGDTAQQDSIDSSIRMDLLTGRVQFFVSRSDWREEIKGHLREGIKIGHLAAGLAPQEVLLWLGIARDGRSFAAAFRRAGDDLRVLGLSSGSPPDRARLQSLIAWHDLFVDFFWAWVACKGRPGRPGQVRMHIEQIRQTLERGTVGIADLIANWHGLCTALDFLGNQGIALRERGDLLLTPPRSFTFPTGSPSETEVDAWLRLSVRQWRHITELVESLRDEPVTSALDRQTSALVEAAGRILDLAPLRDCFHPDDDVVVQSGDVWHAVPVAHLSLGDQPLFQQVRSVRSVVSLLVAHLYRKFYHRSPPTASGPNGSRPRLLTASWFRPDDWVLGQVSLRLHEAQRQLAQRYGLDWFSAAEEPEATPGNLARGLKQHGPFRLVTICGHGGRATEAVRSLVLGESGVILRADPPRRDPPHGYAEALWRGRGCDLSGVEFLVELSCSIGRVSQAELIDVEGFVLDLLSYGVPSVLACRWPVHCGEAVDFANAVVRHYLELRRTEELTPENCLRARAFNLARCEFVTTSSGSKSIPEAGLNVVAAFELYGSG